MTGPAGHVATAILLTAASIDQRVFDLYVRALGLDGGQPGVLRPLVPSCGAVNNNNGQQEERQG